MRLLVSKYKIVKCSFVIYLWSKLISDAQNSTSCSDVNVCLTPTSTNGTLGLQKRSFPLNVQLCPDFALPVAFSFEYKWINKCYRIKVWPSRNMLYMCLYKYIYIYPYLSLCFIFRFVIKIMLAYHLRSCAFSITKC